MISVSSRSNTSSPRDKKWYKREINEQSIKVIFSHAQNLLPKKLERNFFKLLINVFFISLELLG